MSGHTLSELKEFLDEPDVSAFEDAEPITIKVGHVDCFTLDIGDLREAAANEAKIEALVKALGNICQRANELGTGELSLLNAIHDMHYMATAALTSAGEK